MGRKLLHENFDGDINVTLPIRLYKPLVNYETNMIDDEYVNIYLKIYPCKRTFMKLFFKRELTHPFLHFLGTT